MEPTDIELIAESQSGSIVAFEKLVYRYDRDVLTIAARYTQSSDDAKDIYQEVFLRVFRALPKFEGRSEFSTWLYRIATNVCLTYKTRKKKSIEVPLYNSNDNESIDAQGDSETDSYTHSVELSRRIQKGLETLSPRQKMVFTLRHYQDLKLKDIAAMMNCAEGTVKKYLFEATQKMKAHLQDLCE